MTKLTDQTIRERIEETLAAGGHTLRITGDYEISDTVFLPSDFTLILDDSADSPHMDRGIYGVRVGDLHLYGDAQPRDDDLRTVVIRNVFVRTTCAVELAGGMSDVALENIKGFDGCTKTVQDDRTNA